MHGPVRAVNPISGSHWNTGFRTDSGPSVAAPFEPGELLLGTPGYTFGLGFAVRQADGVAGVPGSAGEFMWAGYAGTFFWVDPQEQIVGVYMTQAPSPMRAYYRKMIKGARLSGARGLRPHPYARV